MEFGIYSFADLDPEPVPGDPQRAARRMEELLEEIALAVELGLDVFGIGEHHRPDFIVSAPAVVLAAAAARTRRIRLTSAVTVLSSDDPVRVFQAFATLDLLSGGRAEVMVGRGSFIESFPIFGYDLDDYDALFAEKLDLLLHLRRNDEVTWSGRFRPPMERCRIYPRPLQNPLPVWVATGGHPASAARAGALGLPVALAIIGGTAERFAPVVALHRAAARRAGHQPPPPVAICSHGYVADTHERALAESFPPVAAAMNRIGRERGWRPLTALDYAREATLHGANFVGAPDEVAEKILYQHEIFRHQRFLVQFSVGPLPHAQVMRSIELFGTRVVPAVRRALGSGPAQEHTPPAEPPARGAEPEGAARPPRDP